MCLVIFYFIIGETGSVSWKTRGFGWDYGREFGWDYDSPYWTVTLRSSTVEECEDVTSRLRKEHTEKEWHMSLESLSPESIEVIFSNLNKCAVRKVDILKTPLDSKCVSILSEIIPDNKTMISLILRYCSLTGGIKQISDALFTNTTLKMLSLINVTITDEDTSHLSTMLSINKTLDRLGLTNCNITDNGIQYICEGLTKNQTLTELSITDNPQITSVSTSTIAEAINTTKSLRELHVKNILVNKWHMSLKSLSPESIEVIFKNLNKCAVTELYISNTPLDSKCVSILSEILPDNKTMTDLRFRNCSLTGGIKQISDALFTNTTLKVLSLNNVTITDEDTSHLSTMLSINKTLNTLEFSNCNITDNGVRYICEGLTKNQTLTSLNISDNPQITSVSTSTIAELINTTKSLRELHVKNISFTDDDIKTICTTLCNNTTIRTLYLSYQHYEYCKKLDNFQVIKDRLSRRLW